MQRCETCGAAFEGGTREQCPLDQGRLVEVGDPFIGQSIGRDYQIVERIGEGGMSTVYRAKSPTAGDVAIKVLASHLWKNRSFRERVLREARAANRIRHPHVVSVLDAGELENGGAFLVMEFLHGHDLRTEIERVASFPIQRVLEITRQVAEALAYTHRAGVIHRDIKPSNIFLADSRGADFIRLIDFGVATVKGEMRLTATGMILGTPRYISPEQASARPLSGATDLYSVGVVLYQLLAGRLPFYSKDDHELILQHLTARPPPLRALRPDIPAAVENVVLDLLEKNPAKRPTADDLLKLVSAILEETSSPTTVFEEIREARSMDPDEATTLPEDLAEEWVERMRASGASQHSEWQSVQRDVQRRITEVRDARASLYTAGAQVAGEEEKRETTRFYIGASIDRLTKDVERSIAEQHQKNADIEGLSAEAENDRRLLHAALNAMTTIGVKPSLDSEDLDHLRQAGLCADRILQAEQRIQQLRQDIAREAQRQEALTFQIEQMRGRSAILTVEGESSLRDQGSIASQARRLDNALEALAASTRRFKESVS